MPSKVTSIRHWIGNQQHHSQDLKHFTKHSPVDGHPIYSVSLGSKAEVNQAIETAHQAFPTWAGLTSVQRGQHLFAVTEQLEKHKDDLAEVIYWETGKSHVDALAEIQAAIAQGRFAAGEGNRMSQRVIPSGVTNKTVLTTREPLGVTALLVAYNTPIANIAWKVFPSLICGNTAVLKTSEHTPATAHLFAQLFYKAGLPAGTLSVIHGDRTTGETLVKHPLVQLVSFTGSTAAGIAIHQSLSHFNKKLFLELGGKNPLVVCDDADLNLAVKWALLSSFSNAGQRCASSSRILVFSKVYEEFKSRFIQAARELKIGSTASDQVGPVISEAHLHFLLRSIEQAQKEGGRIIVGGKQEPKNGYYLQPTVIEGISPTSPLSDTELFGPITCLYPVHSLEEAISLANQSQYGLTAAIHTQNIHRAMEFSKRVQAGVVSINAGTHGSEPHMPFGGVKNSGNGLREPGTESLEVYSVLKNICINYLPEQA